MKRLVLWLPVLLCLGACNPNRCCLLRKQWREEAEAAKAPEKAPKKAPEKAKAPAPQAPPAPSPVVVAQTPPAVIEGPTPVTPVPTPMVVTEPAAPATEPQAPPRRSPRSANLRKRASQRFGRVGFETYEEDGRLWVFRPGSKDLAQFHAVGEPAKSVTLIGAGPNGMTLRGPDRGVLKSFQAAWNYGGDGFAVFEDDGRLWAFRVGTESLAQYLDVGEPAKSVTLIGVGPQGKTVRGPDRETVDAFLKRLERVPSQSPLFARPGFEVYEREGRLWVFRPGSEDLAQFHAVGEPAKSVTLVGAGPNGMTIRAPDRETADAYLGR